MKKICCLLLSMLLLVGIVSPFASALYDTPSTPKEVYLEPEQIDENTFAFRDEDGNILAILNKDNDTAEKPVSTRATVYGLIWDLRPSSYQRDTRKFSAIDSVHIYYDVSFLTSGATYIGYYADRPDTYYWLDIKYIYGAKGDVYIGGGTNIYFAIKNASDHSIRYEGKYSTAPF